MERTEIEPESNLGIENANSALGKFNSGGELGVWSLKWGPRGFQKLNTTGSRLGGSGKPNASGRMVAGKKISRRTRGAGLKLVEKVEKKEFS